MAEDKFDILLRELFNSLLNTKGSRLTNAEVDTNFIAIFNELCTINNPLLLDPYDNGEVYKGGDTVNVSFESAGWTNISLTDHQGQLPGSSPTKWERISISSFAHERDRDEFMAVGTVNEISAANAVDFIDNNVESLTRDEVLTKISEETLKPGKTYLLNDRDIFLKALSSTELSLGGALLARNPDFQNLKGNNLGVWTPDIDSGSPGLQANDVSIYNGVQWRSLTGNTTVNSPDQDPTNWILIPVTDSSYINEIDIIEYDLINDTLTKRKTRRNNRVNTTVLQVNSVSPPVNPIDVFQWGNDEVVGNDISQNSILSCLNNLQRIQYVRLTDSDITADLQTNSYLRSQSFGEVRDISNIVNDIEGEFSTSQGTISGSVAVDEIAFGSGVDSIQGAALFIFDGTKLGVGIASPTATAHFKGIGSTSVTFAQKIDNQTPNPLWYVRDDGRATLNNSDFSDTYTLSIESGSFAKPLRLYRPISTLGNGMILGLGLYNTLNVPTDYVQISAGISLVAGSNVEATKNGVLRFLTAKAGVMTTHLTLNENGDVVIGAATALAKLHSKGSVGGLAFLVEDGAADDLFTVTSTGDVIVRENTTLGEKTGGLNKVRINATDFSSNYTTEIRGQQSSGLPLRIFRQSSNVGFGVQFGLALLNSVNEVTDYATINGFVVDNTNNSEDGSIIFATITNGSITEKSRIDNLGNFMLGITAMGTDADNAVGVANGVAPTTSPVNMFQMYSADIIAGNAAPHFRTEIGDIIKLFKSAVYTRNATIVEDRTLLASVSATTINNNNVLAALIADIQATGILG